MKRGGGRIPFVPSPMDVVEKMLSLADPKPDELLVDLGSGDGRIVISAAERYRCRALGVEMDEKLVEESLRKALRRNLLDRVRIVRGDLHAYELADANVVALYLLPKTLKALKPRLLSLPRGSRIVCHDFPIPGVAPDEVARIRSLRDGRIHRIYLYEIR